MASPNRLRITTPRLRLRSWRWDDAIGFDEACNTAAVMRWLGGTQSRSELCDDVAYFMASEARDGVTFWVVERGVDAAFLGLCGLIIIPDGDCPCAGELEIGWRLRESAWRQGYGFEAASAVLSYAFLRLGAPVVVSRTAPGNVASLRLMAKLGLSRRKELDYIPVGERDELLVCSISSGEWHARREAAHRYATEFRHG
jgi:RimJ/RimL family protein N-acetyltransferase